MRAPVGDTDGTDRPCRKGNEMRVKHQTAGAATDRSRPVRAAKTAAKLAAAGTLALGAAVIPTTGASAATTPHCVDHNYVYIVSGGCDGLGGPGHDRMDIYCWANNSDYYVIWYGTWHNRYGSWQENRACGGGWHAGTVWFEHKNS